MVARMAPALRRGRKVRLGQARESAKAVDVAISFRCSQHSKSTLARGISVDEEKCEVGPCSGCRGSVSNTAAVRIGNASGFAGEQKTTLRLRFRVSLSSSSDEDAGAEAGREVAGDRRHSLGWHAQLGSRRGCVSDGRAAAICSQCLAASRLNPRQESTIL